MTIAFTDLTKELAITYPATLGKDQTLMKFTGSDS
jgi:hypothetical protein